MKGFTMTDHEETTTTKVELDTKTQLAKLVAATVAAFVASKFVESAFDKVVVARREKAAEVQQ